MLAFRHVVGFGGSQGRSGRLGPCPALAAGLCLPWRSPPRVLPLMQGGVAAMALSAAATYAPKGIRVNCVAPGLTRTPMTAKITGAQRARPLRRRHLNRQHPHHLPSAA